MTASPKTCCCCGSPAGNYQQHWNRDAGYGLCTDCIDFCARGETRESFERIYGTPGMHYERAPSEGLLKGNWVVERQAIPDAGMPLVPATQAQLLSAPRDGDVYDKTGRKIVIGDVLKVYHYTGTRWRKRHYMYKQVVDEAVIGQSGRPYLLISHLNMKPFEDRDGGYHLAQNGHVLATYEIVQGLGVDSYFVRDRLTKDALEAEVAKLAQNA